MPLAAGLFWQRRQAPHAGARVRHRDDRPRVQEVVRGKQLGPELQARLGLPRLDVDQLQPQ